MDKSVWLDKLTCGDLTYVVGVVVVLQKNINKCLVKLGFGDRTHVGGGVVVVVVL
jgi:hypothetical protein